MAWIELHQSLFDHRKTLEAAEALDLPEVHLAGHLAALWCWCLDNAPDGVLPKSTRIIARGARWEGDPAAFVEALVAAEFIDRVDGELIVHDWSDYGGKLIEKRRENAAKQARYRDRRKSEPVTSPSPNGHVTVTSPSPLPPRNALEKSREEKSTSLPTGEAAPAPIAKPRTAQQQASDALYLRRRSIVDAYCAGLGIAVDSLAAKQREGPSFRALPPVILESPECTPEIVEPLTRYAAAAFAWRDGNKLPSLAEVLKAFPEWDNAGRPDKPPAKVTQIRAAGRAAPPMVERGNVPHDGGLSEWRAAGQRTEHPR